MIHSTAISWFEIPTEDIHRAQQFYEQIFDFKMTPMSLPGFEMRFFPLKESSEGVGGALVSTSPGFYHPSSTHGVLIYLNANPDVDIVLNRVEEAGGKVLVPKTLISENYGHMGVFQDSEGNRIALHSVPPTV